MDEKRSTARIIHNVIIEGREKMSISGVTEVGNFDEGRVTLETGMGTLALTGERLHVNKLSVETGDVEITGLITSCSYVEGGGKKAMGFFGRLLK